MGQVVSVVRFLVLDIAFKLDRDGDDGKVLLVRVGINAVDRRALERGEEQLGGLARIVNLYQFERGHVNSEEMAFLVEFLVFLLVVTEGVYVEDAAREAVGLSILFDGLLGNAVDAIKVGIDEVLHLAELGA